MGTSAVISILQEDGSQISLPISSVTGGENEATLFASINEAVSAYRNAKGF
jgi:hypothetical protein